MCQSRPFFLILLQLNFCASDENPLDLTFTQKRLFLYFTLTRASSNKEEKPLLLYYTLPDFFGFFMALCFSYSPPRAWEIFYLVLSFSSTFFQSSGLMGHVKYSSWNSAMMAWHTLGTNLHMVVRPTNQLYCKDV